jgi:hypothetical protein
VLRLSDENLRTLRSAATPISSRDRARYLEAVAAACKNNPDPGVGEFHRICRAIARQIVSDRSNAGVSDTIDGRA